MQQRDGVAHADYGKEPAVLVLADNAQAQATAKAAVIAAGGRVAAAVPLGEALARLDAQVAIDALMIELTEDAGAALDALLDRVEALARDGRCVTVIAMPTALIDVVSARIDHADIHLLCEPDAIERAAAIGGALATRRTWLNDVGSEAETRRLQQLSEEVGRIARTLASLSQEALDARGRDAMLGDRAPAYRAEPAPPLAAPVIRAVIRARRLRDRFFHAELFADPAWDMLLDLMAARIERGEVAVSSLCIAAAVPPTTALRWIRTLTDDGLLVRRADPADGRRVFIALSDSAAAGMNGYFSALAQTGAIAI
ncbi:winged helix DNA-binding protein [Sphingomonas cavernae]|nr:winged helix DNA-binding protein [Sphingomonas cavernae]